MVKKTKEPSIKYEHTEITDITDIQQKVAELSRDRYRHGKPKLTKEERVEILNECIDGSLIWLKQCVICANAKGVGAATMILERCRLEIESYQRTGAETQQRVWIEVRTELTPEQRREIKALPPMPKETNNDLTAEELKGVKD